MYGSVDNDELSTYEELVTSPNTKEEITLMEEEMSVMVKSHIWKQVNLLSGHKTIWNKWALKVK